MKLKKAFLPLVALMSLTSCGTIDYAGKYQFQLGATKGTHFGIYLDLTNTVSTEEPDRKNFKLSVDIASIVAMDNSSEKASYEEAAYTLKSAFETKGEENDDQKLISVEGTYVIGSDIGEGYKDLDLYFSSLFGIEIPAKLVKDIVVSSTNGSVVSLLIPVSMADLEYQLYWYGYDLTGEAPITPTWADDPAHAPGTHPDKEFVKKIQTGDGDESKAWAEYRDYYTLNMGLSKITD